MGREVKGRGDGICSEDNGIIKEEVLRRKEGVEDISYIFVLVLWMS